MKETTMYRCACGLEPTKTEDAPCWRCDSTHAAADRIGDLEAALRYGDGGVTDAAALWLVEEVKRLRAALVEERAINLASTTYRHTPSERGRTTALAQLREEGLLPPE
jgi:hypothetical protein